jgi:hypothetical protein
MVFFVHLCSLSCSGEEKRDKTVVDPDKESKKNPDKKESNKKALGE